jgi:hypothetical protein
MKMSNDKGSIERAMEIALSCRRCGHPTDATLNKNSKVWTTYCDCGKTGKHLNSDVVLEANKLMKTLPKPKQK